MRIGLHDAEREHLKHKTFPNLAVMKISAWHKAQGDEVEWWNPLYRYDRVYSSKVFDFTPDNPYLPEDAVRGGTGYRDLPVDNRLPEGIDNMFPDYSLYPECDYAVGYLTRGCPNNCRWCVVPRKEGRIRPYRKWQDIVRRDTDRLVLMDNNILACGYGIGQLESLTGSGYRIDLNQGMDARLVDDRIAGILARLDWIRFIRFSCDQKSQILPVKRAIELLGSQGIKPYRIFIYILVTDDIQDAARIWLKVTDVRVERLQEMNADDLKAEGFMEYGLDDFEREFDRLVVKFGYEEAKNRFISLWDAIIPRGQQDLYGWEANPWVWVIEFERCGNPTLAVSAAMTAGAMTGKEQTTGGADVPGIR